MMMVKKFKTGKLEKKPHKASAKMCKKAKSVEGV